MLQNSYNNNYNSVPTSMNRENIVTDLNRMNRETNQSIKVYESSNQIQKSPKRAAMIKRYSSNSSFTDGSVELTQKKNKLAHIS